MHSTPQMARGLIRWPLLARARCTCLSRGTGHALSTLRASRPSLLKQVVVSSFLKSTRRAQTASGTRTSVAASTVANWPSISRPATYSERYGGGRRGGGVRRIHDQNSVKNINIHTNIHGQVVTYQSSFLPQIKTFGGVWFGRTINATLLSGFLWHCVSHSISSHDPEPTRVRLRTHIHKYTHSDIVDDRRAYCQCAGERCVDEIQDRDFPHDGGGCGALGSGRFSPVVDSIDVWLVRIFCRWPYHISTPFTQ